MKKSAAVIGKLCHDLFPEAKNELDAIEKKIESLANQIDFKSANGIDAVTDIELHGMLQLCRCEYINEGKEFADQTNV